jgi:hypothetical protein
LIFLSYETSLRSFSSQWSQKFPHKTAAKSAKADVQMLVLSELERAAFDPNQPFASMARLGQELPQELSGCFFQERPPERPVWGKRNLLLSARSSRRFHGK